MKLETALPLPRKREFYVRLRTGDDGDGVDHGLRKR